MNAPEPDDREHRNACHSGARDADCAECVRRHPELADHHDQAVLDSLARAMGDAMWDANIDGYGDEGAGYDGHVMVKSFMESDAFAAWQGEQAAAPIKPSQEDLAKVAAAHMPVFSTQSGRVVACRCMERVFTPGQVWVEHLADAMLAAWSGRTEQDVIDDARCEHGSALIDLCATVEAHANEPDDPASDVPDDTARSMYVAGVMDQTLTSEEEAEAQWDRWLAAHDAAVQDKALRSTPEPDGYRHRIDVLNARLAALGFPRCTCHPAEDDSEHCLPYPARWLAERDAQIRVKALHDAAELARSRQDVGWDPDRPLMTARFPDDGPALAQELDEQADHIKKETTRG